MNVLTHEESSHYGFLFSFFNPSLQITLSLSQFCLFCCLSHRRTSRSSRAPSTDCLSASRRVKLLPSTMLSFGALAEEDDSNDSHESLKAPEINVLPLSNAPGAQQSHLQNQLSYLREQIAWYESEVAQLENNNQSVALESSSVAGLVDSLLESNDVAVFKHLDDQEAAKQKWDQEDENSTYDVYYPVRSGKRAEKLLGLFHSLSFQPVSVDVDSEGHHINCFKGFCKGPHNIKLFFFQVTLTVNSEDESVQNFDLKVSPWVLTEIGSYLRSQQEKRDILAAMSGLAQYGNICLKRYACFEKLSSSLASNDQFWKRCPRIIFSGSKGIQLILSWKILIDTADNMASSQINLASNYADSMLPKFMSNLPTVFSSLLNKVGVVKAVLIIYEILFPSQAFTSF